ncbi:VOC family protein [Oceanisphaera pacifica]|uniref:VOC family protein n=1 Tax=Oceanisphaera pacifica TaxID=2818389 RepID=A0ABS3NIG3_9GAMM|nr:VOC family protein [Oceanisphaera pacifica]MBO1520369.1 VOC family protein [Oceanisphaera pacifica]
MFSFHHVTLSVRDLLVSEGFYKGLGFESVFRWQDEAEQLQICHLRLGAAILELYCFRPEHEFDAVRSFPPWANGFRLGLRHFALQVTDLDEALNALYEAGVLDEKPSVTYGQSCARYVFIVDPDGNGVELLERPLVNIQQPE